MCVSSYGKVLALGHKFLDGLFDGPVVIQEKIDGSQISFGVFDGVLKVRSNGCQIDLNNIPKLFQPAVDTILCIKDRLHPNCTYRGETLAKPHHNILTYHRVPRGNIVLFDIMTEKDQEYLSPEEVAIIAGMLDLEDVPTYYYGEYKNIPIHGLDYLDSLLQKESCLGGIKIEGVVIKNYNKIGPDGKILRGKYVSKEFKEKHKVDNNQKTQGHILQVIIDTFKSEARFKKTVQKLKELGVWKQTPEDIGAMMKILNEDIEMECSEEIKDMLYNHFRKDIIRGITKGFPEWYKDYLIKWSQF